MPGRTVSSRFDVDLASQLEDVSKADGHAPSRLLSAGAKIFLSMSPPARRIAMAMEVDSTQAEREFLLRHISRAALVACRTILEERNMPFHEADAHAGTNTGLLSEEEIEAEAVRLCAT